MVQAGVIMGDTVEYGGETYETVKIGNQTWFKRNLNYEVEGSKCRDNAPANCEKYGKLYDWATAMALPSTCNTSTCASQAKGICPDGWHIPSNAEWTMLVNFVGSSTAGTKLMSVDGWGSLKGTDNYGFSALPGGTGTSTGYGYWWSATEESLSYAYGRRIGNWAGTEMERVSNYKAGLLSVRCVKN